ncbi:hypothetical protein Z947_4166 [Sulfitobacter geojensis]|nr:hypothetical protein Z947_4166 [Sulfitobacter geojensis]
MFSAHKPIVRKIVENFKALSVSNKLFSASIQAIVENYKKFII